jgi:toxin-antitoxin system, toxin component, Txe/YoeB family
VWKVVITKQAKKDLVNIYRAGLKSKFEKLVEEIKKDPYTSQCEKLIGDLEGYYSCRINRKHRLVYEIDDEQKIVKIVSVWNHY